MQVAHSLDALPPLPAGGAAAMGNFDGLHLAHRALLECVRDDARRRGAPSLALSFEPHPVRILRPDQAPRLITPLPEKIRLLETTGIDLLLLLPFSRDLSLLSPIEFVESILVRGLRLGAVHEGPNFRFGHRQEGTVETLARLGEEFRFDVHIHPEMTIRRQVVSSSRVRELIEAGQVSAAARLLGRWFSLRGPIAQGHGIGRRLTVPTLNLQHYEELLPANGVYVTCIIAGERRYPAVTNVGRRPTFGGDRQVGVESHLLQAPPAEAEWREIEIQFLHRLRDERAFPTPEALKAQILKDISQAQAYLRRLRKMTAANSA